MSWSEARGCRIRPRRTRKSKDERVASVGVRWEKGGETAKGRFPQDLHQGLGRRRVNRFGVRVHMERPVEVDAGPDDRVRLQGGLDRFLRPGHVLVNEDPRVPPEDLGNREEPCRRQDSVLDERLDPTFDRVPGETEVAAQPLVRDEGIAREVRKNLKVLLVNHGLSPTYKEGDI